MIQSVGRPRRSVNVASAGQAPAAGRSTRRATATAPTHAAGYPAKADPARINTPMVVLLLTVLVIYVTMVYGPIAAMLVEMFPTRIRYTSMSLPYHIGNGWFGGFLPTTSFAIVAATGNIYSGLWYPIVIPPRRCSWSSSWSPGPRGRPSTPAPGRARRRLHPGARAVLRPRPSISGARRACRPTTSPCLRRRAFDTAARTGCSGRTCRDRF